jgi:hypothetical protein
MMAYFGQISKISIPFDIWHQTNNSNSLEFVLAFKWLVVGKIYSDITKVKDHSIFCALHNVSFLP